MGRCDLHFIKNKNVASTCRFAIQSSSTASTIDRSFLSEIQEKRGLHINSRQLILCNFSSSLCYHVDFMSHLLHLFPLRVVRAHAAIIFGYGTRPPCPRSRISSTYSVPYIHQEASDSIKQPQTLATGVLIKSVRCPFTETPAGRCVQTLREESKEQGVQAAKENTTPRMEHLQHVLR